jgi:hypothetical protein
VIGVVMIFGAAVGLLNACQADSESESLFRSGEYVAAELDRTLASRRAEAITNLEVEAASVLVAGVGAAFVVKR